MRNHDTLFHKAFRELSDIKTATDKYDEELEHIHNALQLGRQYMELTKTLEKLRGVLNEEQETKAVSRLRKLEAQIKETEDKFYYGT